MATRGPRHGGASLALAIMTLALALAACGRDEAPSAPDATAHPARLEGEVRRDDVWIKVLPLVLHDAKMDLATRCRLLQDEARSKGREAPLCYDATRQPARNVTRIDVEREENMAAAMKRLTEADEGVHFVVDHSGAIYQLLDLAFVARHGGAYPADEVRVIACEERGEKALVAALQGLYPGAAVTVHETKRGQP